MKYSNKSLILVKAPFNMQLMLYKKHILKVLPD